MNKISRYILLFFLGAISFQNIYAQEDRKTLETKRETIKAEIRKIFTFLDKTKKKERSLSAQVQDLEQKMSARQALIETLQSEMNALEKELKKNQRELDLAEKELSALKADYADMVYKSYKHKIADNQLMFLLSSANFYQGYLRFQYLKQYTAYRKKQGKAIEQKAAALMVLNDSIKVKKILQENLVEDEKNEQAIMEKEKEQKEALMKQYRKEKKQYQKQIAVKQKEERELTAQIEKLITSAIKKSTTTKNAKSFTLAPEAKQLAKDFESNKGKLPWPVDQGLVTVRFGTQPDPLEPKLKIESSGVRIATGENEKVKSIFDGKVFAIQKNPQNGVLSVLVQHGNYISVYANLKNVSVSKGDKVMTGDPLGTVFTDPVSGKSILKFQIWKDINKQNPAVWVDKM